MIWKKPGLTPGFFFCTCTITRKQSPVCDKDRRHANTVQTCALTACAVLSTFWKCKQGDAPTPKLEQGLTLFCRSQKNTLGEGLIGIASDSSWKTHGSPDES